MSELRCPNCGEPLQEGSVFCNKCGTKMEAEEVVPVQQKQVALKSELQAADKVIEEAFVYFNEEADLKEQAANARVAGGFKAGIALSAVASGISTIAVLSGSGKFALFITVCLLVFFIVYGVINCNKRKSVMLAKAEEDNAKGFSILDENFNVLKVIPEQYWYPLASAYLAQLEKDNRITTINDALSMCDEYIHRCKMEAAQSQILSNQQQQLAQLAQMSKTMKSTNAAAWISAADAILR